MSAIVTCRLCGHEKFTDFFSAPGVPVTCASIFDTREEALAVPRGDIDLVVCDACSFVFNRSFDPSLGEIGARYESSQAASTHFSAFAQTLAADWIGRYGLTGKTVLEVGSGGGDFLNGLLENGVGRAVGIDPFASDANAAKYRAAGRLRIVADAFDETQLDLEGDALVCRHTLEHVQNVSEFLSLLRDWASRGTGRVLLFEVPAAERAFSERAFWDFYYEHCNYFTEATLRYAFELAGFDVLRVRRVYDDQYLVIEAVGGARQPSRRPDAAAALASYRAYSRDVRASIDRCQAEFERLRASAPPLMLWQGAAKTVGFLAMLENAEVVDGAIDLSPERRGKFLPGSALPVYAPEALRHLCPGHIVLMNPVYLAEVRAQIRSLDLDIPVHSITDLSAGS